MKTIALLYGGRTGEHDVSRCSAASVARTIDTTRYRILPVGIDKNGVWHVQDSLNYELNSDFGEVLSLHDTGPWLVSQNPAGEKLTFVSPEGERVEADMAFPVLHGTYGEDGTLQGLLELAMVPFVGGTMVGSAVGMDKDITKRLVRDAGVPVVPWQTISYLDFMEDKRKTIDQIAGELLFPLFIKPANAGSSVGIKRVTEVKNLEAALEFSFDYDNHVLVEQGLEVREIECAVLGNSSAKASIPGEVIPSHDFYSYEAKYIDPQGAQLVIPADISQQQQEQVRRYAVDAFHALHGRGLARVDFFIEKETGDIFFNEINTMPGFTSISMYPRLWDASGLSYPQLIKELIRLGFEEHALKKRLKQEL